MHIFRALTATIALAALIGVARGQSPTTGQPETLPWTKPSTAADEAAAAANAAKSAAAEAKAAAAAAKSSVPAPVPAQAAAKATDGKPAAATANAGAAPASPTAAKAKPTTVAAKELFGAVKSPAAMAPRSIGSYAKGCLAGAATLPIDGPAWQAMRLSRNRNYGHPQLIALLERFANEMKTKENWPGLLIGDLAQPRGGPMLTGHKSHQVGLDADIWFKPMPVKQLSVSERETFEPLLLAEDRGTEVIAANWNDGFVRLVKRAASYPEVERIFVHPAIKKAFCAKAGNDRAWLAKVRPMWLHNYHFHVRMACPKDSPTCEKQADPPGDDGCGKELENWLKLVSTPPKPEPKPSKPSPPSPSLKLEQLPPECRSVLAAGEPGAPAQQQAKTGAKSEPVKAPAKSAQQ